MSYTSLDTASKDQPLNRRVIASVQQEARTPAHVDSDYGKRAIDNPAEGVHMVWPVALATEAEYESALAAGTPNPGGDEAVIADAMILSAVQASWPADTP